MVFLFIILRHEKSRVLYNVIKCFKILEIVHVSLTKYTYIMHTYTYRLIVWEESLEQG